MQRKRDPEADGEVFVGLVSPDEVHSACKDDQATACAWAQRRTSRKETMLRAWLILPDDLDELEFVRARGVIAHEMLHALGIQGHVTSREFPDSIMGTHSGSGTNQVHILGRSDREVLQASYMSRHPERYNDWGSWDDTATCSGGAPAAPCASA